MQIIFTHLSLTNSVEGKKVAVPVHIMKAYRRMEE
jgi:hypothetical protein